MVEIDVSGLPTSWAIPAASRPKPAIFSWCMSWAWVSCSSPRPVVDPGLELGLVLAQGAFRADSRSPTRLSRSPSELDAHVTQPRMTTIISQLERAPPVPAPPTSTSV